MIKIRTLLILLLSFPIIAYCQKITITGQITDIHNEPISLATVDIVGKNASNTSDDYGVFHITMPSNVKRGDVIVVRVSKQGFKTLTKQVSVSSLSMPIHLVKIKNFVVPKAKALSDAENVLNKSTGNNPPGQPPVSVQSFFQSGGITANQVNMAPLPRQLDELINKQLLDFLTNKNEMINITSVMGDADAFQYAKQIAEFLKANGYTKIDGVNQGVFNEPIKGQFMKRDTTGVKIVIGATP